MMIVEGLMNDTRAGILGLLSYKTLKDTRSGILLQIKSSFGAPKKYLTLYMMVSYGIPALAITYKSCSNLSCLQVKTGLNRCGKSCRLRWTNYLRPDIKRGKFSAEEEQAILNLHSILGNKWSAIATHLPGRTDNEIKNFWNTHLKKKLIQMGFDPMTHRPRTDFFAALPGLLALANLQELVDQRPWEAAEAVQTAKLHYLQYLLQSSSGSSVPQQNPNPNISIDQSTSTLTGINIDQSFNSLQPYGVDTTGLMNQPLAPCSFGQIGESNFVSDELQLIPNCYEQQQQQQQQQPLMESLPPLADFSGPAGNLSGDACSSSSCGVSSNGMPSSFWPEVLLDDPFMNEFA